MELATAPGDLVIFNGDKLWHAVTPLGDQEERIVLTLEYVTNPDMGAFKRLYSNLKIHSPTSGLWSVFAGLFSVPARKSLRGFVVDPCLFPLYCNKAGKRS